MGVTPIIDAALKFCDPEFDINDFFGADPSQTTLDQDWPASRAKLIALHLGN
jgi:hypothetical protein